MPPAEYQTPGVYVQAVNTSSRPIEAVEMSTAGFVGIAPNSTAPVGQALALHSWRNFQEQFIATPAAAEAATPAPPPHTNLAHAVYGFFQNGGRRAFVVNIGKPEGDNTVSVKAGLDVLAGINEIAIVAAPGYSDKESYEALRLHCEATRDRLGILDGPAQLTDEALRVLSGDLTATQSGWTLPERSAAGLITLYVPWLVVANPVEADPVTVQVPPSGHIAGIWARNDFERGVHKAPANELVRGALDLQRHVTEAEHGPINANGVNVIREFTRRGILVWGARTISSDPEWQYVNVRRLATMIVNSVSAGTRWVVFEPNDEPLWQDIRRDVALFLTEYWRQGALMGFSAHEAFFVKCDAENNLPAAVVAGEVTIDIGLAMIRPAEFHIFRIVQSVAGLEISEA